MTADSGAPDASAALDDSELPASVFDSAGNFNCMGAPKVMDLPKSTDGYAQGLAVAGKGRTELPLTMTLGLIVIESDSTALYAAMLAGCDDSGLLMITNDGRMPMPNVDCPRAMTGHKGTVYY